MRVLGLCLCLQCACRGVRGQCMAPSSVSEEACIRIRAQATSALPLSCRNTLQQTLTPNLLFPIKKPGSQTSSVLIRVRLRYCWKCACVQVAGFFLDSGSAATVMCAQINFYCCILFYFFWVAAMKFLST